MTKMPPKLVRLGFERDCVEVPLDQIRCPISLPGWHQGFRKVPADPQYGTSNRTSRADRRGVEQ